MPHTHKQLRPCSWPFGNNHATNISHNPPQRNWGQAALKHSGFPHQWKGSTLGSSRSELEPLRVLFLHLRVELLVSFVFVGLGLFGRLGVNHLQAGSYPKTLPAYPCRQSHQYHGHPKGILEISGEWFSSNWSTKWLGTSPQSRG